MTLDTQVRMDEPAVHVVEQKVPMDSLHQQRHCCFGFFVPAAVSLL